MERDHMPAITDVLALDVHHFPAAGWRLARCPHASPSVIMMWIGPSSLS